MYGYPSSQKCVSYNNFLFSVYLSLISKSTYNTIHYGISNSSSLISSYHYLPFIFYPHFTIHKIYLSLLLSSLCSWYEYNYKTPTFPPNTQSHILIPEFAHRNLISSLQKCALFYPSTLLHCNLLHSDTKLSTLHFYFLGEKRSSLLVRGCPLLFCPSLFLKFIK